MEWFDGKIRSVGIGSERDQEIAEVDITKMQQQAVEYLTQCQYTEAIALYEQCIDADPTLMSNYWHLGLAWLLQGEESEAQAIWLSATAQGPLEKIDEWMMELLQLLQAEAIRHLYSHKLELAERIYWQILELDSNQAEAHYNLGNAIAQQGDLDAAILCWQRAINLKSDFAEAYHAQGCVLQKLEEFAEAIPRYLKALEIKPDWTETYYNLGLCFSRRGKLAEAIACFEQATQLKLDYTQAYGDWGNALLQQSKLDEAIISFKKATQLQPSFAQSYCNWTNNLEKQGQWSEEASNNAYLLKSLLSNSTALTTYLNLGKILAERNELENAILLYQKATQLHPELAETHLELGKLLAKKENYDEAISAYHTALKIKPELAETHLELGKLLAKKENYDEAISAYHTALKIKPELTEIYGCLGNVLLTVGRWDEAIAYYQNKLELQPDSIDAYYYLGIAFAQQSKTDEALSCLQTVMEINPDVAKEVNSAIIMLYQQGKLGRKNLGFQQAVPINSPAEFYESTWDWAVTSNLETSNYFNIHPKNTIYLTPPKTLDKALHFSFRFGSKVELPATFVAIVPDGRYWLSKGQTKSATITLDNKLLADVSPEFPALSPGHLDKHPSKLSIFTLSKLPPIKTIDGTLAVLSGLSNDVYFHWMFDILPRIELLHRSGIDMAEIDKFLINSELPFQKETLNTLGIAKNKIIGTHKNSHIKATRLVVPSFPASIAWMPKWACDFLRDVFLDKKAIEASEKIERLYISRSKARNRRIINEDEVIILLEKFGFKSVTLESMSVKAQAALLANAKVVVAPHGGGLTNTVFCSAGTKVIEIFSPNYVYPCYWLISNLVELEYYYLLGDVNEGFYLHKLLYPSPRVEDIFVNINKLLDIMELAGVTH